MDFKGIRTFVALAEHLHFGHAAEHLRVAQPHVSRRIKQLEEELDALLFYRDKRNVRLTEAGEVFLVEAKKLLQRRRHRQGARPGERARQAGQSQRRPDHLGDARGRAGHARRVSSALPGRLAVIRRGRLRGAPRRSQPWRGRCGLSASAHPRREQQLRAHHRSSGSRWSPCCPARTGWRRGASSARSTLLASAG